MDRTRALSRAEDEQRKGLEIIVCAAYNSYIEKQALRGTAASQPVKKLSSNSTPFGSRVKTCLREMASTTFTR